MQSPKIKVITCNKQMKLYACTVTENGLYRRCFLHASKIPTYSNCCLYYDHICYDYYVTSLLYRQKQPHKSLGIHERLFQLLNLSTYESWIV